MSIVDRLKELAHEAEALVEDAINEAAPAAVGTPPDAPEDSQPAMNLYHQSVPSRAQSAHDLANALHDLVPSHWDSSHPSADLFEKARTALEAYQALVSLPPG